MKTTLLAVLATFALPLVAFAATPAQEKAFVDAYKAAYEGKDAKALHAMLYTKGADPQALEFYKMMTTDGMGAKISSIALEPPSVSGSSASEAMPGPGGKSFKLTLKPVKKLVIKKTQTSGGGSSTSTSTVFVAEADGKLVIPVPGPAK